MLKKLTRSALSLLSSATSFQKKVTRSSRLLATNRKKMFKRSD
jgi:hypothetical protein